MIFLAQQMLQQTKPYSKTLRQLTKVNSDHTQASLSYQRSLSTYKPLPSLRQPLKIKSNSYKLRTECRETDDCEPADEVRLLGEGGRQNSFTQQVDNIMCEIIVAGEDNNEKGSNIRDHLEQRRKKNLRIVTEQGDLHLTHKRSKASSELEEMMLRKEITRERLLRQKYLQENPQVEKKVSTRWGIGEKKGTCKQLMAYYPLAAVRQETHELLVSIPARSEDYLRKLRQTALNRLAHR